MKPLFSAVIAQHKLFAHAPVPGRLLGAVLLTGGLLLSGPLAGRGEAAETAVVSVSCLGTTVEACLKQLEKAGDVSIVAPKDSLQRSISLAAEGQDLMVTLQQLAEAAEMGNVTVTLDREKRRIVIAPLEAKVAATPATAAPQSGAAAPSPEEMLLRIKDAARQENQPKYYLLPDGSQISSQEMLDAVARGAKQGEVTTFGLPDGQQVSAAEIREALQKVVAPSEDSPVLPNTSEQLTYRQMKQIIQQNEANAKPDVVIHFPGGEQMTQAEFQKLVNAAQSAPEKQ